MGKKLLFFVALAVLLSFASPVWADDVTTDDPPVLTVTTPGCGAPCRFFDRTLNDGINLIGPSLLRVTDTGSKPPLPPLPALVNPVLLILGFPNVSSTFVPPAITLSQGTGAAGGPNVYPSTTTKWDANGFAGVFSAAFIPPIGKPNSVEAFLGLVAPGGSGNTFARWQTFESDITGIAAQGFGMVVYELYGTGLMSNSWFDVFFGSRLPRGTIALAYGCSGTITKPAGACPGRNTFTTQVQQIGIVVPEPASLILFGSGLLVTGALRRRHKKQQPVAAV